MKGNNIWSNFIRFGRPLFIIGVIGLFIGLMSAIDQHLLTFIVGKPIEFTSTFSIVMNTLFILAYMGALILLIGIMANSIIAKEKMDTIATLILFCFLIYLGANYSVLTLGPISILGIYSAIQTLFIVFKGRWKHRSEYETVISVFGLIFFGISILLASRISLLASPL